MKHSSICVSVYTLHFSSYMCKLSFCQYSLFTAYLLHCFYYELNILKALAIFKSFLILFTVQRCVKGSLLVFYITFYNGLGVLKNSCNFQTFFIHFTVQYCLKDLVIMLSLSCRALKI